MQRFGDLIAKKARLGIDSWGSTDQEVPEVVEPIHALDRARVPGLVAVPVEPARDDRRPRAPHPLRPGDAPEYAERFRDLGDDDLDALADSFALARCVTRTRLCDLLASRTGTAAGQA